MPGNQDTEEMLRSTDSGWQKYLLTWEHLWSSLGQRRGCP
jgi:hypothetical protein